VHLESFGRGDGEELFQPGLFNRKMLAGVVRTLCVIDFRKDGIDPDLRIRANCRFRSSGDDERSVASQAQCLVPNSGAAARNGVRE